MLNLLMKTEHIKAGADATVFVHIYLIYIETRHVLLLHLTVSAPAVTGSVFMRRFRLFLRHCTLICF